MLLWVAMFLLSGYFLNNSLIFNITIDNSFKFSYPIAFYIDNIYINESLSNATVSSNTSFKRPVSQIFSTYTSLTGKFSFSYPSAFLLSQKDFPGSDILYHIDFHNATDNSHGFVQVWALPYSLEDFLEKSKSASLQTYKNFKSKPVNINNNPGILWDYSVLGNDGRYIKGSEVFFKKDGRMYRISYFIPETNWNKTQSDIFWSIANSFKTY